MQNNKPIEEDVNGRRIGPTAPHAGDLEIQTTIEAVGDRRPWPRCVRFKTLLPGSYAYGDLIRHGESIVAKLSGGELLVDGLPLGWDGLEVEINLVAIEGTAFDYIGSLYPGVNLESCHPRVGELRDLPLNSPCGLACKRAADADCDLEAIIDQCLVLFLG